MPEHRSAAEVHSPPAVFARALAAMGLVSGNSRLAGAPLTGGVSCEVWRIDLPAGPVCVKYALERLRVAQDWRAPASRIENEVDWLAFAGRAAPGRAAQVLGFDRGTGVVALSYYPPEDWAVWKTQLREGRVDLGVTEAIADALGKIHAASAREPALRERFTNRALIRALRLDPYFGGAAEAHPDRAGALHGLQALFAANEKALVHGDFSPKNMLVGPDGPVILDAETAVWGDPAFDLAFCLNHLLLKSVWTRSAAPQFQQAFNTVFRTVLSHVDWEAPDAVDRRASAYLAGLLLARIDAKSPVEYLNEAERSHVRALARDWLAAAPVPLAARAADWFDRWRDLPPKPKGAGA